MPDLSESRRLLERARLGERSAVSRLLANHEAELRRFLELRLDVKLRRRVDVSDLVQETHLAVMTQLADYAQRDPMPFRLWLFKTAYQQLIRARRRHINAARRTIQREVPLPVESSVLIARAIPGAVSTPSQEMLRREVSDQVVGAVALLSDDDREILLMRNAEGRLYEEIAYLLDIDPAAARKRYGRALVRLRNALARTGVLECLG